MFLRFMIGNKKLMKIFVLLLVFILCSCQDNLSNKLVGTWKLARHTTPTGNVQNYDKDLKITFHKENNFNYSHFDYDLWNDYKGKYFINYNQNRINRTLMLIPDTIISGQDTIRLDYISFDLIELSDSVMVVHKPTKFINRVDDGRNIRYNEIMFFSKINNSR